MKKIILVSIAIVFFFNINFVSASGLIINEIMYNPQGDDGNREWVELFNNGNESITVLSGSSDLAWRFDDGAESLHKINNQLEILSGGYAILASNKDTFVSEYSFSGLVADTTMTLNNNGLVKIWNGENPRQMVFSKDYSNAGADNNNKSLQWTGSKWVACEPTPGTATTCSESEVSNNSSNDSDNSDEEDSDTSSSFTSKPKETAIPVLKTKILTKTTAFVGQPVEFLADVKYGTATYLTGRFFWNFGDGDSTVVIDNSGEFSHTYFYPGEYNVTLDYFYKTSFLEIPDFTNEIIIKVLPMTVSISKVGDVKDFFVELTNNADNKIDISGWLLSSGNKYFVLPKNTVISPKKSIIISGKISGFVFGDEKNLKLIMPTSEVVYDYSVKNISTKKIVSAVKSTEISVGENTFSSDKNFDIINDNSDQNLLATAVLSDSNIKNFKFNNFLVIVLAFILGIGGASAVYFLRRGSGGIQFRDGNSKGSNVGDDFSILDE
jgi:hypothetical protein